MKMRYENSAFLYLLNLSGKTLFVTLVEHNSPTSKKLVRKLFLGLAFQRIVQPPLLQSPYLPFVLNLALMSQTGKKMAEALQKSFAQSSSAK